MSGPVDEGAATLVVCRFVRERNALLCVADFGPMFMDCYLHLGQNSVVLAGGADEKLKLLLAALALHAAAQPRAVTCAWTLHLEKERWNIFAVAENPTGHVTGQVFAENVREVGVSVLHSEVAAADGLRRRSSVDLPDCGVLKSAEAFYAQSEQRVARYFDLAERPAGLRCGMAASRRDRGGAGACSRRFASAAGDASLPVCLWLHARAHCRGHLAGAAGRS